VKLDIRHTGKSILRYCNAGFGGAVDVAGILDFIDSGRDVIIAGDIGMSDAIRDLANECGVEFDEVNKKCTSSAVQISMMHMCMRHIYVCVPQLLFPMEILNNSSATLQDANSAVIDHLNFAVTRTEMDHTLIASDSFLDSPVILGSEGIRVGLMFLFGFVNLPCLSKSDAYVYVCGACVRRYICYIMPLSLLLVNLDDLDSI
jgi:hypothetical protein